MQQDRRDDRITTGPQPTDDGPMPSAAAPEPQQQAKQEDPKEDAREDKAPVDQAVGEDVRRWPNGELPTDPDEYEHYVETKLSDYTHETADKIPDWWKSADEKKLREKCKVSKELHDELRNKAATRKNALLKG